VAVGDRVLVKDQTSAQNNGVYVVAAGAWARAADANTATELAAAQVPVLQGDR
jgi:phage-related tail fiber protein